MNIPRASSLTRKPWQMSKVASPPYVPLRFKVQLCLHEGGSHRVFSAIDHETSQSCIVKCAWTSASRTQVKQEVKILRSERLKGVQGIPVVLDFGEMMFEYEDVVYSVLTPLGTSLDKHVSNKTTAERAQLVQELKVPLEKIVGTLRERGFIHQDIKPANVIVTDNKDVYLIDFGLAVDAKSSTAAEQSACGTSCYMSPSASSGKPPCFDDDVYSLHRTLYALARGVAEYEEAFALTQERTILGVPESVWSQSGNKPA
jgi:eukaryotic-like serine/threonine-protein kinase